MFSLRLWNKSVCPKLEGRESAGRRAGRWNGWNCRRPADWLSSEYDRSRWSAKVGRLWPTSSRDPGGGPAQGCLGPPPALFSELAHIWPAFLSTYPVAWNPMRPKTDAYLDAFPPAVHPLSSLWTFPLPPAFSSSGPCDVAANNNSQRSCNIYYPNTQHISTHSILFS